MTRKQAIRLRKTADLVALILAGVVAVVVIATAAVLLFLEITRPDQDSGEAADFIGRVIGTLVAALVGFMAGRATEGGEQGVEDEP